jgi:hypothetical protein
MVAGGQPEPAVACARLDILLPIAAALGLLQIVLELLPCEPDSLFQNFAMWYRLTCNEIIQASDGDAKELRCFFTVEDFGLA